ncbi:DUF992 domain-containing protein [Rhizobium tubonense]|uniref:DUF992 domain-containing protein n=1 Tax=Rhizobium tubonense TaxID=484088 RepID=A0A2W4E6L8_9HYPH|nr:DUF992 domain-containing protein [Rhizobium tubonense]PZM08033.1 hypothetical protein CPY51_30250 [Rhizobium tubonense]
MRKLLILTTFSIVALMGLRNADAARSEVGTLNCDISAGLGVIIGAKQDVSCIFKPSAGGASERYVGNITEFGLDLGEVDKGKMTWLVYTATDRNKDALTGSYRGATAEASLGLGAGVNILVGGNDNSLSLQPLSIQGEEGVNLAIGVAALTLRPAA